MADAGSCNTGSFAGTRDMVAEVPSNRVSLCQDLVSDLGCHLGCHLQAGVADITAALRNYRPSQTVLEAEVAAPRRSGMSASLPLSGADDSKANVMRLKRQRHDDTIQVSCT